MTQPATYYLAERLTTTNWLTSIWPRLKRAKRSGASFTFHYVDATRAGARLARAMCRRLGVEARALELDAGRVHDEEGLLVWLRIYYRDLAEVLQYIAADPEFPRNPAAAPASRNALMYLRKQCVPGLTLFLGPGMWRSVYLVQAGRWHAQRQTPAASSLVLWLENHPWFEGLERYARSLGAIELVPLGRAYRPARLMLAVLARDLKILADGLLNRTPREDARPAAVTEAGAPTIALQYYGQFNLEAPELHSDFFFWQQSKLDGRHIVGLFTFPQDRLDAARIATLGRHGMRGVALRRGATTVPGALFSETSLARNAARAAAMAAHAIAPASRAWIGAQTRLFESEVAYWERLLRHCNAKVFLTWFKYNADPCAVAEAARRTGGVFALYQRSFEGNPSAQTAVVADLAFGFSRQGAAVERASGSIIDYYVVTGYLGDHRFPMVRESSQALRESLRAAGAEFIVAYFDENSFPDPRWGVGPERTRSNYAFVLERVLTDPRLGLVLKPKTPRTLRARLGPVAETLDRALATGRCRLLGEGIVQGSVPPVQAALAADVAIHESAAAGTAAIEAALAGVPTLIIDHDGWTISPLYRLGLGAVIFMEWDALWSVVDTMRAGRAAEAVARWEGLLPELDPFRDGRAAERMGTFLQWVIESYRGGASRDEALARSAQRYAESWGADKVITAA